jgi:hypothetical protein
MKAQILGARCGIALLVLALACERGNSPSAPAQSSGPAPSRSRGVAGPPLTPNIAASAEHDEHGGCTNASLMGTYGLQRMGHTSQGSLTAVGIATFDGEGASAASETVSRNGVFADAQSAATYTVSPDCTATLSVNSAIAAHLEIVHGGSAVLGMSLVPGDNVASHYERVVDGPGAREAPQAGCTNAILTGSYGFQRMGQTNQGQLTSLGMTTFDGQGTDSGGQTTSRNGVFSVVQFPRQPYMVNPDCTGALILNGAAFAHLVIVHGGSEVLGMSLTPGNNVAIHFERVVDRPGSALGPDQ